LSEGLWDVLNDVKEDINVNEGLMRTKRSMWKRRSLIIVGDVMMNKLG